MSKLLGSILLAAALVTGDAAFACPMQQSTAADGDQTAQAPATDNQTTVPPAGTTAPKTTETKTGG
jgi:hypothetical protein